MSRILFFEDVKHALRPYIARLVKCCASVTRQWALPQGVESLTIFLRSLETVKKKFIAASLIFLTFFNMLNFKKDIASPAHWSTKNPALIAGFVIS